MWNNNNYLCTMYIQNKLPHIRSRSLRLLCKFIAVPHQMSISLAHVWELRAPSRFEDSSQKCRQLFEFAGVLFWSSWALLCTSYPTTLGREFSEPMFIIRIKFNWATSIHYFVADQILLSVWHSAHIHKHKHIRIPTILFRMKQ